MKTREMKTRENGLDYLRIIAACGVVLVHVVAYFILTVMNSGDMFTLATLIKYRNLSSFAVPAFVMISGAFIFLSEGTKDFKKFYKKTFHKLVIPTIVFTIIYIITHFIEIALVIENSDFSFGIIIDGLPETLTRAFRGEASEHLWYMFMLIVLYIFAPFVMRIKDGLSEKGFRNVAIILLIWGVLGNLAYVIFHEGDPNVNTKVYWSLDNVINFLGLFMSGYVVHEFAKKIRKKVGKKITANIIALICIIVGFLICYSKYSLFLSYPGKIFVMDFTPLHPFFVVAAIFLVFGFSLLDIKCGLTKMSAATYWVYLVHPAVFIFYRLVVSKIKGIGYSTFANQDLWPTFWMMFAVCTVISFIVGIIIDTCIGAVHKKKSCA